MNNIQYQQLLMYRKTQETLLYLLIENTNNNETTVRDVLIQSGIPYKRCLYILSKWEKQGKYEYGVSIDLGWLTK